jgi:hypothetical protein
MRNDLDKICRENQKTHTKLNKLYFPKIVPFMKYCGKPTNYIPPTHKKLSGMTTKIPTSGAWILRAANHFNNQITIKT